MQTERAPEAMPVRALETRYVWRVACPYYRQYRAIHEPTCGCQTCWEKWDAKHPK